MLYKKNNWTICWASFVFWTNSQRTINDEQRTKWNLNTTYNFNWFLCHNYKPFSFSLSLCELTIILTLLKTWLGFPLLHISTYCSVVIVVWQWAARTQRSHNWMHVNSLWNLYLLLLLKHFRILLNVSLSVCVLNCWFSEEGSWFDLLSLNTPVDWMLELWSRCGRKLFQSSHIVRLHDF